MKTNEAIKQIREKTVQRKFSESVDIIINLKNIDLKKPENKFSKEVLLPHGRGKDVSVGVISNSLEGAVTKQDIEEFETDKKKLRAFMNRYDFLVAEAPLMPLVGKVLGKYLAPKGKMPKLLPPGKSHESLENDLKRSVRIRVRDSPVIHALAGTEAMTDQQLRENVEKIVDDVKKALPKGENQIKDIFIKTTMGRPVRVEL